MISITLVAEEPDAARIAAAFGRKLGLAVPATDAQIKNDVIKYVEQVTLTQEQQQLYQNASNEVAQIPPVKVV
jgi:hypothetical protein